MKKCTYKDENGNKWIKLKFLDGYYLMRKEKAKYYYHYMPFFYPETTDISSYETKHWVDVYSWIRENIKDGYIIPISGIEHEELKLWRAKKEDLMYFNWKIPTLDSGHMVMLGVWTLFISGIMLNIITFVIGLLFLIVYGVILGCDLEKKLKA